MKNLLLLLITLACANSLRAQLYVTPNTTTSTDSYIYVNDQLLFVEQDVNLVQNTNDPNTRASIYLRNDSQLIQGATASSNSGTGLLSVQQNTPDDDSWDYTYWCSPIGNPTLSGGTPGNKNFGILSYYNPTGPTAATQANHTFGHNGFISPFTISNRWIYTHTTPGTEAASNYTLVRQNYNIPPGFGFTMKGLGTTNHDQNYDFRGRPNNGSFVIPVDNLMMTLSGNPYPSALDLAQVFTDNASLASIWYWDEDRTIDSHTYIANRGGYGTWVPAGGPGGTYTTATFQQWNSSGSSSGSYGSGATYERRYAPIGQGFMLIGNTNGNVTINNSQRVFVKEGLANNSQFRNNDGNSTPSETEDERWPQIRFVSVFNDGHTRENVLLFSENSTDGYDQGQDGFHPMDATAETYFTFKTDLGVDERKLVIETVPFEIDKHIPVAFKLNQQTKIDLRAIEIVKLPNIKVYLYDILNNRYQEIKEESENAEVIPASILLPAGTYENRFYITFKEYKPNNDDDDIPVISRNNAASQKNVEFFQNNPAKQLEVSNPDTYDIKSLNIFDMGGKLVYSASNVGNSTKLSFPTGNLSDAVYVVRLTTIDDQTIVYKINVVNK
ncbi:MAG: hypothetical protein R2786_07785 [Flavobacteriaceae bacterium]